MRSCPPASARKSRAMTSTIWVLSLGCARSVRRAGRGHPMAQSGTLLRRRRRSRRMISQRRETGRIAQCPFHHPRSVTRRSCVSGLPLLPTTPRGRPLLRLWSREHQISRLAKAFWNKLARPITTAGCVRKAIDTMLGSYATSSSRVRTYIGSGATTSR